jgi:hypothetical protein
MASTISAGTTSGTAIAITGDTSGNLAFTTQTGTYTQTVPNATGTIMVSGNMPAIGVYMNTSLNVTSSVATKVPFNVKEFDTANCYDNATNYRFTPNVAGYYQINAAVDGYGNAVPTRAFTIIYKNGSEFKRGQDFSVGASGYIVTTNVSSIVYLNGSTDYIEIYATVIVAAGTAQIYGQQNLTYFNASLIRTA